MPQLDAGIGCGGLGFFAACGAQALASLMDFETELGFYMVSFILICFRLPRLKITASLWQTNAPAAKISRLAAAIAHRAPARYQDIFFFFFRKKLPSEEAERKPKGGLTLFPAPSYIKASTPDRLHPTRTYTHTAPPAALTRQERRG